jgi:hypothetical protein
MSAVHLALRTRAESLVVCGTGSASIAAVANGFTRASGSFLSDGLTIGQDVVPAGFNVNTSRTIKTVSALSVVTVQSVTPEAIASGRSLSVTFPVLRSHENADFKPPTDGRGYSEEDFVPATRALVTNSPRGRILARGLYVVRWYAPAKSGTLGLSNCADALVNWFPVTWVATLADGTQVRMRGELLPWRGQVINTVAGSV